MLNNRYGVSRKALHSTKGPAFLGGIRFLTSSSTGTKLKTITNPITLTVQPAPMVGISCLAIAG